MDTGEEDNRESRIYLDDLGRDESHTEVSLAISYCSVGCSYARLDILHIGEPLTLQEFFGHVLRCLTNTRNMDQLERRRLQSRLRSNRLRLQTKEPCRSRESQFQELPSAPAFSVSPLHGNLLL